MFRCKSPTLGWHAWFLLAVNPFSLNRFLCKDYVFLARSISFSHHRQNFENRVNAKYTIAAARKKNLFFLGREAVVQKGLEPLLCTTFLCVWVRPESSIKQNNRWKMRNKSFENCKPLHWIFLKGFKAPRNSILFPRDSQGEAEGNIKVEGKQNSLLPAGPVIKCFFYISQLITR